MSANKVIVDGETIIDLTQDTATVEDVAKGKTFHLADGTPATGIGSGGGGTPEGFHMVRFFNDDRTTLLYTVFVPTGASAMYAGETPASTVNDMFVFEGFQPAATNVTRDMDCFAVYSEQIKTLDQTSWAKISELSADGTAQNYFAIGDTKMVHIEGMVGTLTVNDDYGVYIIGFDHNEEIEGKGIHFGTFKTAVVDGKDICITDSKDGSTSTDGTRWFNANHWGNSNGGGWGASDIRYDILGSTDIAPSDYGSAKNSSSVGYDATETCATNPVDYTLMAALPPDLRAVMKPMTKYTNNKGGKTDSAAKVTATIDYLPFLAEFEVSGVRTYASAAEQDYQARYAYYASGKSAIKYNNSSIYAEAGWWVRGCHYNHATSLLKFQGGACTGENAYTSKGIAPIFKV